MWRLKGKHKFRTHSCLSKLLKAMKNALHIFIGKRKGKETTGMSLLIKVNDEKRKLISFLLPSIKEKNL